MPVLVAPSAAMARGPDRSLAEDALQHLLHGQATVSVVPMNHLKITADKAEHIFPVDYCETCAIPQDCRQHGPLRSLRQLAKETQLSTILPDPSTTRKLHLIDCNAVSTLPREVCLCTSSIPEAGFGICSRTHIRANTWMGPYEGRTFTPDEIHPNMNTEYMWEVYENGRLIHYVDASDANCSNWMRFVQCARNSSEQNMQAVQYNKLIYYCSMRDILPAEELLVWYDPETYELAADVPVGIKEDGALSPADSQSILGRRSSSSYAPLGSPPAVASSTAHLASTPLQERRLSTPIKPIVIDDTPASSQEPSFLHPRPSDYEENGYSSSHAYVVPTNSAISSPPGSSRHWPRPLFMHGHYGMRNRMPTLVAASGGGYYHDISRTRGSGWQCGQCKQTFGQRLLLQTHKCPQSHIDQPYQCGLCLMPFGNTAELHTHVAGLCSVTADTPHSERPFRCAFCSRTFAGTTTLQNHIRTHTGEKPYHCERCHEEFARMVQLTRHSCTWASRHESNTSSPSEGESLAMTESTTLSPPPAKRAASNSAVQAMDSSADITNQTTLSDTTLDL